MKGQFWILFLGWKNSVRHNLSLHPIFVREQPSANSKVSYWCMRPQNNELPLIDDYDEYGRKPEKKRKRERKGTDLNSEPRSYSAIFKLAILRYRSERDRGTHFRSMNKLNIMTIVKRKIFHHQGISGYQIPVQVHFILVRIQFRNFILLIRIKKLFWDQSKMTKSKLSRIQMRALEMNKPDMESHRLVFHDRDLPLRS